MKKPRNKRTSRAHAGVREPVQVYLDPKDRELLERVADTLRVSRAEALRRGIRSLAADALAQHAPGWSIESLTGCLGDDPSIPTDLAARHEEYLVRASEAHARRNRVD